MDTKDWCIIYCILFNVNIDTHICIVSGTPAALYDQTNPDWAPSVNMGYQGTPQSSKRYERAEERKLKKKRLDVAESLIQLSTYCKPARNEPEEDMDSEEVPPISVCKFEVRGRLETRESEHKISASETNGSETPRNISQLTMEELNRLTVENMELKDQLKANEFSPEFFEGNDERVRYFTGLSSYLILMAVFNFLQAYIPQTAKNVLTEFQMLVLVLI